MLKEKLQSIILNKSLKEVIKELGSWNSLLFYKKNGKIIRYADWVDINIIDFKQWEEERDNLTDYGIDYDFNKSFFENFKILMNKVPWPNVFHYTLWENIDYSDTTWNSKNVYLSKVVILDCENVYYSFIVKENSVNVFNSVYVIWNNSNIYNSLGIFNSYNVFYSRYILNSSDIWFSSNLIWCRECIFCDWLENKSYCINNIQYDKEEYLQKKQEILSQKYRFEEWYLSKVNKHWKNLASKNVKWNFIVKSENIENGYFVDNSKNCKNVIFLWWTQWDEDIVNAMFAWSPYAKNSYNSTMYGHTENVYFSWHIWWWYNVWYSMYGTNINNCFGTIWLKNKEYCILNKQYSKEEYNEMIKKILNQMDKEWILWKFFPAELSLFNFNDTWSTVLTDFNKEEIISEWYKWRDEGIKVDIPSNLEIVSINDIDITNFNESILKKIITDDKWNYWRIMPYEYKFMKKYGLPLSKYHWLDRIRNHFVWICWKNI